MQQAESTRATASWVPLAYGVAAHLGLGSAAAVTLWNPTWIAGFYYHPKMVAVVHCLTLGWISSGIVALLYARGPRFGLRPRGLDIWVFFAWLAGASGLASHFWIETFGGMVWSAGLLAAAGLLLAGRFAAAVAAGPLPAEVKLLIQLAWLNFAATAFIGILLGINKTHTVLPGYSLHNVFAHVHLAVLGWAFPALVAVGHLLLSRPENRTPLPWASACGAALVQLGAVGIFVSLLTGRHAWALPFGWIALAGMLGCAIPLALRARREGAPAARTALLVSASIWLAITALIAMARTGGANEAASPETVMAYGAAGLLGALGQVSAAWTLEATRTGADRMWPATLAWLLAAPALVVGLASPGASLEMPLIRIGSGLLLLATLWSTRSLFRNARTSGFSRSLSAENADGARVA